MNIINMPGFTAELSLHRTNDYYQTAALSAVNQEGIFPAQFGEIPAPDGPDFPGRIPGLPDIPQVPPHRLCFYPCQPFCFFPSSWGGRPACFYPCRQRCIWL
jgi:hypothetical protein